jgi:hypothetical protein
VKRFASTFIALFTLKRSVCVVLDPFIAAASGSGVIIGFCIGGDRDPLLFSHSTSSFPLDLLLGHDPSYCLRGYHNERPQGEKKKISIKAECPQRSSILKIKLKEKYSKMTFISNYYI